MMYHTPRNHPPARYCFPLPARAWAFQERILGPRVLHFGPNELLWECSSEDWCECGRRSSKQISKTGISAVTKKRVFVAFHSKMDLAVVRLLGRDCVEEYSSLNLTYEEDRLPAIAGIATSMQTARTGVYLAGLWSDTLVLDMLWFSLGGDYKPLRAPSWSWASGEEGVSFLGPDYGPDYYPVAEAEAVDFHCELDGFSLTGKVKSG